MKLKAKRNLPPRPVYVYNRRMLLNLPSSSSIQATGQDLGGMTLTKGWSVTVHPPYPAWNICVC